MAKEYLIQDPIISLPEIKMPLYYPGEDEKDPNESSGTQPNPTDIQQTKVFGILMPLLALNGVVVDHKDLIMFELKEGYCFPKCKFKFKDRSNMFKNISDKGNENELQVQIIPHHDNTYKKINLMFRCDNLRCDDGVIEGDGEYKLDKFTEKRFKSYPKMSTYQLCELISTMTGLGFASNVEDTPDERNIQFRAKSFHDVIETEVCRSYADEVNVFDWWIDMWNTLHLCNWYERINYIDSEDDLKIWMCGNPENASVNDSSDVNETIAMLTNHPVREHTDLYACDMRPINKPTGTDRANEKCISVYEEWQHCHVDHYIADGDVKNSANLELEYMGEVYGDYNYKVAEQMRQLYIDKIYANQLAVHINNPLLSIPKGHQVRFLWYDNNQADITQQNHLEEAGVVYAREDIEQLMGWVADWNMDDVSDEESPMKINLNYSGQYTSLGQTMRWDKELGKWDSWINLVRPANKKPPILVEENDNE